MLCAYTEFCLSGTMSGMLTAPHNSDGHPYGSLHNTWPFHPTNPASSELMRLKGCEGS